MKQVSFDCTAEEARRFCVLYEALRGDVDTDLAQRQLEGQP